MRKALMILVGVAGLVGVADATPTDITVRVLSRDAKFIGSKMGGLEITLTDTSSGKVLASGRIEGGTGDTDTIMRRPRERGASLSTEDSARFDVTLDLDVPTLVEVAVRGPASPRSATLEVSSRQWVLPGKDITAGDGWLLEMRGLAVAVWLVETREGNEPAIGATVTMLCGCPLTPGGLWDSNDVEIWAEFEASAGDAVRVPLRYADTPSEFIADVFPDGPGPREIRVFAYQKSTGNSGFDRIVVNEED